MLRHLGEHDAALKIRNAIDEVYRDRTKLTRDVGGNAGTSEFADAIIQASKRKKRRPKRPHNRSWYWHVILGCIYAVDEQTVERARKRAEALGKSLNQLIRDYLQKLAGGDDAERRIAEFRRLSGGGHSRGWRFDRNEIHERS